MRKLTFLGDIMCDLLISKSFDKYWDEEASDYRFDGIFSHIKPLLEESDFVLANLETPLTEAYDRLTHKPWTFNTPRPFAQAVKDCGVDFVTTANNHCLDNGIDGLNETIDILDAIGLDHCGTQRENRSGYRVAQVGGLKISILAYTYGTNAFSNQVYLDRSNRQNVNLLQAQEGYFHSFWLKLFNGRLQRVYRLLDRMLHPDNRGAEVYERETLHFFRQHLIRKDFRRVRQEKPDVLIALLHIGGQYNRAPSKYTLKMTDWFRQKGCDIVVDNHEHVIHGMKLDDDGISAYALGNCLGSAGVLERPYDRRAEYSIALHVYIDDGTRKIERISFSVLKSRINAEGRMEVWEAPDLIDSGVEIDAERAIGEALQAAKDFSGLEYAKVEREFIIRA